jgi:hypothetical protein
MLALCPTHPPGCILPIDVYTVPPFCFLLTARSVEVIYCFILLKVKAERCIIPLALINHSRVIIQLVITFLPVIGTS